MNEEKNVMNDDIKPVFRGRDAFIFEGDKQIIAELEKDSPYLRGFKYDTRQEPIS